MDNSESNSPENIIVTARSLKPMWTPLFNLGLAALVSVIAAVAAFMFTSDLRDGGTLIAVPVGLASWFVGDILRWRGRYPIRLFLMVPIFVALICTVSIRFVQKANQRRIAWNSMIDAGASVKFETVSMNGWTQYDEGIFLPEFLEDWLGRAVFANSAKVAIPMVSFASETLECRVLRTMNLEKAPIFDLEISDSRNDSKIDLDAFSNLCNSKRVGRLSVNLYSPNEETILALQAIKRPYYLYLSGVLSEKAMRHLPADNSILFLVLKLNDPPDQTSWLNFLPSSPNCMVHVTSSISAASLRTIDPERPLCRMRFELNSLDDNAIREIAKLSKADSISMRWTGDLLSQDTLHAVCKSPISLDLGPVKLTPESVQLLIENEERSRLHLLISSIDSDSFQRLAKVKCLKSIYVDFDLTEQDIQSIALFPAEVEFSIGHTTNKNQSLPIYLAIRNRR